MEARADISFNISPTSGVPIYRQIVDQVERLVSSGVLASGDLLPSVNEVSRQLSVNPMTVSRAYHLLCERGLLDRDRGIGMRVAEGVAKPRDARLELLRPSIDQLWLQADQFGLERSAVIEYLSRETGGTP